MKAVRLQRFGDADQFRLEDAPDPVAGRGEVLIRVAVSALNPVDLYVRQGMVGKMERSTARSPPPRGDRSFGRSV
jgi:NADPH:quinone reductase-like Zn-dependent oxidoreductase